MGVDSHCTLARSRSQDLRDCSVNESSPSVIVDGQYVGYDINCYSLYVVGILPDVY